MTSPHVLIIGAGIIGASIAWHLARRGAPVTILDAARPGGVATRHSWAWINASSGNPEPYFRLRQRSMAEWHRLAEVVPALAPDWSGGLIWDAPQDALQAFAARHGSWGYDLRPVDRSAAASLEPWLRDPPDFALHAPEEGSIEPLAAAEALLDAAVALGARLLPATRVLALDRVGDRIIGVVTESGRITADEVILAAGIETPALAATAGLALPLTAPPGLLIVTRPHARRLNGLVMAPDLHLRQTAEGRIIAGGDFGGTDPGADPSETAADLFRMLCGMLRSSEDLAFDHYLLGHRPTPPDGFPAVGRFDGVSGLYAAVMHSGITLAPAIGRFVAEEVLTGEREPLLAPFGVERFAHALNPG